MWLSVCDDQYWATWLVFSVCSVLTKIRLCMLVTYMDLVKNSILSVNFVCSMWKKLAHYWTWQNCWSYGGEGYIGDTLSLCSSVRVSNRVHSVSPEPLDHFLPNGMVVYYHEVMCHVEKLVHCLQCQGHNEDLYDKNMTFSTISSKQLVCLQPNLVW